MKRYFYESKKFYYSIFFILPFLFIYEVGLFKGVLGKTINGADAILRMFFYFIFGILGITVTKALVAVIIFLLAAYLVYYLIKNHIKISLVVLFLMLVESMAMAFVVAIFLHLGMSRSFPKFFTFNPNVSVIRQIAASGINGFWQMIIASVGAGVFEELLFRVILIRVFYQFWKHTGQMRFGQDIQALSKASLLSSTIFAFMHIGTVSIPFGLFSVFMGSIALSAIYIKRGYGIAAATHIFYDIFMMLGIIS